MNTPPPNFTVVLLNDNAGLVGGAERQVQYEADLLEARDVTTEIVATTPYTGDKERIADRVVASDGLTPDSSRLRYIEDATFNFEVWRELRAIVREIDPDVIHVHKNEAYSNTTLLATGSVPTVMTHHDYKYVCPTGWSVYQDTHEVCPGGPGKKCVDHGCKSIPRMAAVEGPRYAILDGIKNQYVDMHVAPSQRLSEYLNRHGFDCTAIGNPAVDRFEREPSPAGDRAGFVYVGSLDEHKGIHVLLDAVRNLCRRGTTVDLEVVGDGPSRDDLKVRAAEHGIEDAVTFRGYLPDEEMVATIGSARAVVAPSIWMENFPNVVTEAFLLRRPVIASNRGGLPQLVGDSERGLLYDALDPKALADRLLTLHDDPSLATKMGDNGRTYAVTELDPDRQVGKLLETLVDASGC